MAKIKRKRRSSTLRGPASLHEKEMRRDVAVVRELSAEASRFALRGWCAEAKSRFIYAIKMHERMICNFDHAKSKKYNAHLDIFPARKALTDASYTFAEKCVIDDA